MSTETFYLAGGCFWCLDAAFRELQGVQSVVSGYANGKLKNPTYEMVCTGMTGYTEAVAVTFDPEVLPRDVLLDIFFTIHDPRQLNRQGNDVGTQYRGGMYYQNETQQALFEAARDRAAETWDGRPVTEIVPLENWYDAEDYHQDFFAKNPWQGYCLAVALPKVNKVRRQYADYALSR
jgi:peptide-methionine (S)-S-oxide reductase